MPNKIKRNTRGQTKTELLFFSHPKRAWFDPEARCELRCSYKKHQQTGSRKRLINQKYFIKWSSIHISDRATLSQRSFVFFETMRLKRLIVFRQLCSRRTPLLSGRRGCRSVHWQLPVCSQWERRVRFFYFIFSPVWSPGSSLTRFWTAAEADLCPNDKRLVRVYSRCDAKSSCDREWASPSIRRIARHTVFCYVRFTLNCCVPHF